MGALKKVIPVIFWFALLFLSSIPTVIGYGHSYDEYDYHDGAYDYSDYIYRQEVLEDIFVLFSQSFLYLDCQYYFTFS
jgi:hypothetical protein